MNYPWLEDVLDIDHFSAWLNRRSPDDVVGFPAYLYGGRSSPIGNYLREKLAAAEGYQAAVWINRHEFSHKGWDRIPPEPRRMWHHTEGTNFVVPPWGFYVDWEVYPMWKRYRDLLDIHWVVEFLTREFERKDDPSLHEALRGEVNFRTAHEWLQDIRRYTNHFIEPEESLRRA